MNSKLPDKNKQKGEEDGQGYMYNPYSEKGCLKSQPLFTRCLDDVKDSAGPLIAEKSAVASLGLNWGNHLTTAKVPKRKRVHWRVGGGMIQAVGNGKDGGLWVRRGSATGDRC